MAEPSLDAETDQGTARGPAQSTAHTSAADKDQVQAENKTETQDHDRGKDLARMRRIGAWHGTAVLTALTLWGAAELWAGSSGLLLASAVSIGMAIAVGTVVASILHEWGHFTGARLAGARSPVRAKPARFYFMFNFDMEHNTPNQFLAMSIGGISANWLFVLLIFLLIPMQSVAAAALAATAFASAVNVSLFEVPVVLKVREGYNPADELQRRLDEYGLKRIPGWVAGLFMFLAIT